MKRDIYTLLLNSFLVYELNGILVVILLLPAFDDGLDFDEDLSVDTCLLAWRMRNLPSGVSLQLTLTSFFALSKYATTGSASL
jgi:hypothetical protein